jgi:GxxExxY protein
MLEDEQLSAQIIGAAIVVHKQLGPGFLESVYEQALAVEFRHVGLPFQRQFPVSLQYRGELIGEHRLDFLVAGRVVVELKAIQELEKIHFAIVRSYLKATNLHFGLLLNFAAMPLTVKRVGREDVSRSKALPSPNS